VFGKRIDAIGEGGRREGMRVRQEYMLRKKGGREGGRSINISLACLLSHPLHLTRPTSTYRSKANLPRQVRHHRHVLGLEGREGGREGWRGEIYE